MYYVSYIYRLISLLAIRKINFDTIAAVEASVNHSVGYPGVGEVFKVEESLGSALVDTGYTWAEILQQPDLWPTTVERVANAVETHQLQTILEPKTRVLLTGAGTSAYAASAIAAVWPRAIAVPSTDLLIDTDRYLPGIDCVISIGRSGNSPESVAAVERIHKANPRIVQLAITCNAEGSLAQSPLLRSIDMDPRTDDKSLVMTSSFSNLVIAGLSLANKAAINAVLPVACSRSRDNFDTMNEAARQIASKVIDRVVLLCSPPLFPWAQEGALKALEMTAGKYPVLAETYLGLRHGPMTFVCPNTVVLCLLSNDSLRRCYERDLIEELREKRLGYLVGIGARQDEAGLFDALIPAVLPTDRDELRTPFEILGPQLLGYHLSLRSGLNPDSPSSKGIISRVVQGVKIYKDYEPVG
jgi:tagatose-6-phosphate ketose/aldose isomerase